MSTPSSSSPPTFPAASASRRNMWLWWSVAIAVLAAGLYITWWVMERQRQDREWLERYYALKKQVTYTSELFPATVTFPRGPARKEEAHAQWEKYPRMDMASCPDDTEGTDFAEFYEISPASDAPALPFADVTHPKVKRILETALFFAKAVSPDKTEPYFQNALIMKEFASTTEATASPDAFPPGWTVRLTLLPSPYGGAVLPENLTPAQAEKLGVGPGVPDEPTRQQARVDPRSSYSSPNRYGGSTTGNAQRRAEADADRKFSEDKRYYLNRYHHLYIVEAGRDFGQGRVIILRRIGTVLNAASVSRAEATVRNMASSVVLKEK